MDPQNEIVIPRIVAADARLPTSALCDRTLLDGKRLHRSIDLACSRARTHHYTRS